MRKLRLPGRIAAAFTRWLRPAEPPPGFADRLEAAIARDPGLLLRVTAVERSLAANDRGARPNDSNL